MRPASFAAVCAAVSVAMAPVARAAELGLSAAARAEGRLRSPLASSSTAPVAVDALIAPSLDAAIDWGSTQVALRYSADVLLRNLVGESGPVVPPLHQAQAALRVRRGRASLLLTQDVGLGTIVVSALDPLRETPSAPSAGGAPGASGDASGTGGASGSAGPGAGGGAGSTATPGPSAGAGLGVPSGEAIVPYLSARTTAQADVQLAPRLGSSLALGYRVSGATDGSSTLPLQRGPVASGRLEWRVDRTHALAAALEGQHLDFSTGHRQTLVRLEGSWSASLHPRLGLEGSFGAAFARQELPTASCPVRSISCVFMDLLPVAGLGVRGRQLAGPVALEPRLRVQLAPFADRYTGLVYERVEAQAGLGAALRRELAAALSGTAAWSVPLGSAPYVPSELLSAEGEVSWTPVRWMSLGANARIVRAPRATEPLWSMGLALTLRTDTALAL